MFSMIALGSLFNVANVSQQNTQFGLNLAIGSVGVNQSLVQVASNNAFINQF